MRKLLVAVVGVTMLLGSGAAHADWSRGGRYYGGYYGGGWRGPGPAYYPRSYRYYGPPAVYVAPPRAYYPPPVYYGRPYYYPGY